MAQKARTMRRDPRVAVSGGKAFVEFDADGSHGARCRAELVEVSVAGMTFELEAGPQFRKGAVVANVTVHIGDCVVAGELLVKHSEPVRKSKIEVGCLFYPSSQFDEEKLSAVLAGLQVAKGK